MISSIYRLGPSISMNVASNKALVEAGAPEQESHAFYVVTGLLTLSAGVLAIIALAAVAAVFLGGV